MNRPCLLRRLYAAAAPAAAALLPLAAPFSAKLREGVRERRGLLPRLLALSGELRGALWFHAASVGEYEQVRPVLAELRRRGHGPLVVSHFSPSGARYARRSPEGDRHVYLPWDTPAAMQRLVTAWRPRLLVFAKYDCWPNLVAAARHAGVPAALAAASLPPRSWRARPPGRSLFRCVADDLSLVAAAWPRDAAQFRRLGTTAPVTVAGDPRAEQVLRRLRAAAGDPLVQAVVRWRPRRVVLGSTWPPDEKLWLPLLPRLLADDPGLGIVIAPHEPSPRRLGGIAARLDGLGIAHRRLDAAAADSDAAPVLLVDRVGVLAGLYTGAVMAHVGGGFGDGVHSTLEPAGAGAPVTCGPRMAAAADAAALREAGALTVVRGPDDLAAAVKRWLGDPAARERAAAAAGAVVAGQAGAAARTADLLEELLARPALSR